MSDEMDDLEKFADAVSLRTGIRSARGMAGLKNGKKIFERGRLSIADSGSLRLSVYEPSLPKLKFLEGKDE